MAKKTLSKILYLRLDPGTLKKICTEAERENRNISGFVRNAIDVYFKYKYAQKEIKFD